MVSVDSENSAKERIAVLEERERLFMSELQKREHSFHILEKELGDLEKRHLADMRKASQIIHDLRIKVDAKSRHMTPFINSLNTLSKDLNPISPSIKGHRVDRVHSIVQHQPPYYNHLPSPPRTLLSNRLWMSRRGLSRVHRGVQRLSSAISVSNVCPDKEELDKYVHVTSASSRRTGLGSSLNSSSVPSKSISDHRFAVSGLKNPTQLPPISTPLSNQKFIEENGLSFPNPSMHRVFISSRADIITRDSPSQGTFATLAIDHVTDANWNLPLPGSHNSDYK